MVLGVAATRVLLDGGDLDLSRVGDVHDLPTEGGHEMEHPSVYQDEGLVPRRARVSFIFVPRSLGPEGGSFSFPPRRPRVGLFFVVCLLPLLSLLVEYISGVLLHPAFAIFFYDDAPGIRVRGPLGVSLSGPLSPHSLLVLVWYVSAKVIPVSRLSVRHLSGCPLIELGDPNNELLQASLNIVIQLLSYPFYVRHCNWSWFMPGRGG